MWFTIDQAVSMWIGTDDPGQGNGALLCSSRGEESWSKRLSDTLCNPSVHSFILKWILGINWFWFFRLPASCHHSSRVPRIGQSKTSYFYMYLGGIAPPQLLFWAIPELCPLSKLCLGWRCLSLWVGSTGWGWLEIIFCTPSLYPTPTNWWWHVPSLHWTALIGQSRAGNL